MVRLLFVAGIYVLSALAAPAQDSSQHYDDGSRDDWWSTATRDRSDSPFGAWFKPKGNQPVSGTNIQAGPWPSTGSNWGGLGGLFSGNRNKPSPADSTIQAAPSGGLGNLFGGSRPASSSGSNWMGSLGNLFGRPRPEAGSRPEPKPVVESAPQSDTASAPQPETQSAPQPEAQSAPQPEAQSAPQPEAASAPKPETESVPKPVTESAPKPETESSSQPQVEAAPRPETVSAPKPNSEACSSSKPSGSSGSSWLGNFSFWGRPKPQPEAGCTTAAPAVPPKPAAPAVPPKPATPASPPRPASPAQSAAPAAPFAEAGSSESSSADSMAESEIAERRKHLWQPNVGSKWQIILDGVPDTKKNVLNPSDALIWDIDLWDAAPSNIADLKKSGKKVICYFSAGTSESWRPDYQSLSSYNLGKVCKDDKCRGSWGGEEWLDIRQQPVRKVMQQRIKMASTKGCDAIDPDNVDGYDNPIKTKSGKITRFQEADSVQFLKFLADDAARYNMSMGLKNSISLIPKVQNYVQFAVNEECVKVKDCAGYKNFLAKGKPVFHIEYTGASRQNNRVTYKDPAASTKKYCNPLVEAISRFSTIIKAGETLGPNFLYCDGKPADVTPIIANSNSKAKGKVNYDADADADADFENEFSTETEGATPANSDEEKPVANAKLLAPTNPSPGPTSSNGEAKTDPDSHPEDAQSSRPDRA